MFSRKQIPWKYLGESFPPENVLKSHKFFNIFYKNGSLIIFCWYVYFLPFFKLRKIQRVRVFTWIFGKISQAIFAKMWKWKISPQPYLYVILSYDWTWRALKRKNKGMPCRQQRCTLPVGPIAGQASSTQSHPCTPLAVIILCIYSTCCLTFDWFYTRLHIWMDFTFYIFFQGIKRKIAVNCSITSFCLKCVKIPHVL